MRINNKILLLKWYYTCMLSNCKGYMLQKLAIIILLAKHFLLKKSLVTLAYKIIFWKYSKVDDGTLTEQNGPNANFYKKMSYVSKIEESQKLNNL